MKQVLMTKGLSASGKSTAAKALVENFPGRYAIVSNDALRTMLHNGKWSPSNEKQMLTIRDQTVLSLLGAGVTPIVDATHLHPRHETRIKQIVKGIAEVDTKTLDFSHVDVETCVARDRVRWPSVGEAVIRKQYRDFLMPKPETPVYNPSLPDCVLVDLDGTLAVIGDRSPYDAARCEVDSVSPAVQFVLEQIGYGNDYASEHSSKPLVEIILLSGRDGEFRQQTVDWLKKHEVRYDELFMRPAGDRRRDDIVKEELYRAHIEGRYNVKFVLDDRDRVVQMWRDRLGLTCFQVAYGDF